jgi:hypothetical protein
MSETHEGGCVCGSVRYVTQGDPLRVTLDLEFCSRCGTNIGFTLEWRPGARIIDAGTFDDPSWI